MVKTQIVLPLHHLLLLFLAYHTRSQFTWQKKKKTTNKKRNTNNNKTHAAILFCCLMFVFFFCFCFLQLLRKIQ